MRMEAIQIAKKDIKVELRSKTTLNFMLLFSFVTISIFSISVPVKIIPEVAPSLLWLVFLFVGIGGYARAFVREVEDGTLDGLKMIARPTSILAGKILYNLSLMLIIQAITLPLFIAFFNLQISQPLNFIVSITVGNVAFVVVSSSLSLLTIRANARELLLPVILFPVIFPIISTTIRALSSAINGSGYDMASIGLVAIYTAAMTILAFTTVEQVMIE
jgi:heme exporter protein B